MDWHRWHVNVNRMVVAYDGASAAAGRLETGLMPSAGMAKCFEQNGQATVRPMSSRVALTVRPQPGHSTCIGVCVAIILNHNARRRRCFRAGIGRVLCGEIRRGGNSARARRGEQISSPKIREPEFS
jgi:hypothetical protein